MAMHRDGNAGEKVSATWINRRQATAALLASAAVQSGCEAAVVLDGRVGHAMLLEFFTARGAGTLVRA